MGDRERLAFQSKHIRAIINFQARRLYTIPLNTGFVKFHPNVENLQQANLFEPTFSVLEDMSHFQHADQSKPFSLITFLGPADQQETLVEEGNKSSFPCLPLHEVCPLG